MWYVTHHPKTAGGEDFHFKKHGYILDTMLEWMSHVDCTEDIQQTRGRPKKNDAVCQYKKPGIILVGDTGVGKTVILDMFGKMCHADAVQFECQKMSRKNYEEFFKQAMTYKNITDLQRRKFIRFDDMESLAECDNIQLSDIMRCVKNANVPFVGTLHRKFLHKILEFKRYVNILVVDPPSDREMMLFMQRVYEKEGRPYVHVPFIGHDIRLYMTQCEHGWTDHSDIFVNDGNKAIVALKQNKCVGYSVHNVNIILHENYPYMNRSCESIKYLSESDIFMEDTIENPYIDYIDTYGNKGTIDQFPDINKLRPASLWTKTSNMHYKKKLLKEKVRDLHLDNTYDALTTFNALRLM